MKATLGHDGPPAQLWRENLVTDAPLAECPLRSVLRARTREPIALELDLYAEHYTHFKAGHLLIAGGMADQPARYAEFMTLLGQAERNEQDAFERLQERKREVTES